MKTQDSDSAIVAAYGEFDVPADRIVSDPQLAAKFREKVNAKLPSSCRLDLPALNHRLLNLRRKGSDKGGLPKLRRNYNGRGPNRPR